jgi:hypothetical protein
MARQASTPSTRLIRWRLAAVILLSLEASLGLGNMLFLVGSGVFEGQNVVDQLDRDVLLIFMIMAFSPAALSLLAIFLLKRAPRAAVLVGLGLQGALVLYGLAITFVMSQPLGLVAVAMGVGTALCLGAVTNDRSRA